MSFKKTLAVVAVMAASAIFTSNAFAAFTINTNVNGNWWEDGTANSRGWAFTYLKIGPESGAPVVDDTFDATMTVEFLSCNSATVSITGSSVTNWEGDWSNFATVVNVDGLEEDKCIYQREFTGCPDGFQEADLPRSCLLTGTYTQDVRLTNEITWVLSGGVFIGPSANQGDPVPENGPTLFIEAGTRIVDDSLDSTTDTLVISRGSRIIAEGQPHAPIVMTGRMTQGEDAIAGQWGGLVVNGAAPINDGENCDTLPNPPCEANGEGGSGYYGGNDAYDDSGVLKYLRVQFAGELFSSENELNGIALQGVGSGTVVDYVQVHRNADDGIEFFGGTVNAKHLVLTDIEDDSVDWTEGFTGSIQYVLVVQSQVEGDSIDKGFEMDNLGKAQNNLTRSQPRVANVTVFGAPGESGMVARAGTGGNFSNMIVVNCSKAWDIDETATFNAAGGPGQRTGVLTMENTILDCATNIVTDDEEDDTGQPVQDPWSVQDWFDEQEGNREVDPMLEGFFPPMGADYLTGFPLNPMVFDDFFEDVDHVGAFRSRSSAWIWNWTEFLDF
ncbi:MAG: hypothetical protein HKP03_03010 [Xanthomonadales bacterium]|nr:hypothetical protein [Xanthomonadales bacterium]